MGRYISASDIEAVFGADNVAAWSNLDSAQASADEARIAAAIAYAESAVDDRFRGGPYAVPFTSAPPAVVDWIAKLAGVWLYESRGLRDADPLGHRLAAMKRAVEAEMSQYLSGQRRLDAPAAGAQPGAPTVTA